MFGALRRECDQHASGHREEYADIQVEINKGKCHDQLHIGNGMPLSILSLVDGMITHNIGEV